MQHWTRRLTLPPCPALPGIFWSLFGEKRNRDGQQEEGAHEVSQIDHMLLTPKLARHLARVEIKNHAYVDGAVSDHWPIVAHFDFSKDFSEANGMREEENEEGGQGEGAASSAGASAEQGSNEKRVMAAANAPGGMTAGALRHVAAGAAGALVLTAVGVALGARRRRQRRLAFRYAQAASWEQEMCLKHSGKGGVGPQPPQHQQGVVMGRVV